VWKKKSKGAAISGGTGFTLVVVIKTFNAGIKAVTGDKE